MSLAEFDKMLARHDWLYQFTDDHNVWRRGYDAHETIRVIVRSNANCKILYDAWVEYNFPANPADAGSEESMAKLDAVRRSLGVLE